MPIYEYQCKKCDHEFEREQRITADPIKTCPKCKARRVKKLISQTSFVLKGGGWYNDLYSSSKKDSKSGASEDANATSSDSASDKSKSKDKKGDKGKKTDSKKPSKSAA
ncbi:MAG: zinc ribbon domain-containing protein [Myxococcales bacterium]|nr:zinc ribbon domain-containing protein [Myxococcales bacterium]